MKRSNKYSKIKLWYDMKVWSEARVRNAVEKGWLTSGEFTDITGVEYQ